MNVRQPIGVEPLDDDEEVERADAYARVELDAGRGVSHEEIRRWAKALGTPDAFPMPGEWRG